MFIGDIMQKCKKCFIDKPLSDFPKHSGFKMGVRSECKTCYNQKHRNARAKNPELYRAKERLRWKEKRSTPEAKAKRRKNYEINRDTILKQQKQYYDRNKKNPEFMERLSRNNQKWKKANKQKVNQQTRRRRAVRLNSYVEDIPQEFIDLLLIRQKNLCRYCLVDFDLEPYTLEHIVPLSRGGKHEKRNIALVCKACNSSKRNKTHTEYLEYLSVR